MLFRSRGTRFDIAGFWVKPSTGSKLLDGDVSIFRRAEIALETDVPFHGEILERNLVWVLRAIRVEPRACPLGKVAGVEVFSIV